MRLSNTKILITGASGFMGTALINRLKKYGAKVSSFDLDNGYDITNNKQLEAAIKKQYDVIYHLAGFSGSRQSNIEIVKSLEINSYAVISLIENIVKYSPKSKLILSGSRLEYGKPQYLPVDEKHPLAPNSAYGLSKLLASQAALMYSKTGGINVTIMRTSNVYGPHPKNRFRGYNVINHFIDLALKNQPLPIFGDGKQMRDYIYIDDLIDAFILALKPESKGNIYNLGYGEGIEFKKMIKIIISTVGSGRSSHVPWPIDYKNVETGNYISDITKIKKELGFEPKINFEEGIIKTVQARI